MEHSLSQRQVLDVATSIGYRILLFGGEANRAEDTVMRIGLAYGMDEVHVFAIASSIMVTIEKDGEAITQTRRIARTNTNLNKLDKLNNLSREICRDKTDFDTIVEKVHTIDALPVYPTWIMALAYALIGGSFSVFFGGGIFEFITGFLVGACILPVVKLADFLQSPPFFYKRSRSSCYGGAD